MSTAEDSGSNSPRRFWSASGSSSSSQTKRTASPKEGAIRRTSSKLRFSVRREPETTAMVFVERRRRSTASIVSPTEMASLTPVMFVIPSICSGVKSLMPQKILGTSPKRASPLFRRKTSASSSVQMIASKTTPRSVYLRRNNSVIISSWAPSRVAYAVEVLHKKFDILVAGVLKPLYNTLVERVGPFVPLVEGVQEKNAFLFSCGCEGGRCKKGERGDEYMQGREVSERAASVGHLMHQPSWEVFFEAALLHKYKDNAAPCFMYCIISSSSRGRSSDIARPLECRRCPGDPPRKTGALLH